MESWKLPQHPDLATLREIAPEVQIVHPRRWHRIYFVGGPHPTRWNELRYFGPSDARFDHHETDDEGRPTEQGRGIVYCASDIPTCLAEVFQFNRGVDPNVENPWLVSFDMVRPMQLLDLTGLFPVLVGASQAINTGFREFARNWSRGFHEIYREIEGLYYHTSMTGNVGIDLFERILENSPFPNSPAFNRPLNDPTLSISLQEACADIGYRALW